MLLWNRSSLILVLAWCLFGTDVELLSNRILEFWRCLLQNVKHFVWASMILRIIEIGKWFSKITHFGNVSQQECHQLIMFIITLITRLTGPSWGPSGAGRTQVGPMLAPWTLLSVDTNLQQHCIIPKTCLRITYIWILSGFTLKCSSLISVTNYEVTVSYLMHFM